MTPLQIATASSRMPKSDRKTTVGGPAAYGAVARKSAAIVSPRMATFLAGRYHARHAGDGEDRGAPVLLEPLHDGRVVRPSALPERLPGVGDRGQLGDRVLRVRTPGAGEPHRVRDCQ